MVTAGDQPEMLSKEDKSHTMPREATIPQPAETSKEEVLSGIWNNFEELLVAETQEDFDKVNANFDIDCAAEVIRGDNMSNHTVVEELVPPTRDEAVAEAASDGTYRSESLLIINTDAQQSASVTETAVSEDGYIYAGWTVTNS